MNLQPYRQKGPVALTVTEFCNRYNLSRATLHRIRQAGELRARKAGKRVLIPVEEAERWWSSLPDLQPKHPTE